MSNLQEQMLPSVVSEDDEVCMQNLCLVFVGQVVDVSKSYLRENRSNLQHQMLPLIVSEDAEICKQFLCLFI